MPFNLNIVVRRLSKMIVFLTLSLIFVGALIKSHEVGLSVPDWPTSYGKQMFSFPYSDMIGGIFYEHGHRLFATLVGFLTLLQFMFISFTNHPSWIKKMSLISLILVITQGLLGGMTVLFFLPPPISIMHGVLAQTFFVTIIFVAYSLSESRANKKEAPYPLFIRRGAIFITLLVFIQLVLGALVRHTSSGLAIPDFPKMGGLWVPTFSDNMINNINAELFDKNLDMVSKWQVLIHFLHRLGAFIIALALTLFVYKFRNMVKKNSTESKALMVLVTVLAIQISLGIATILTERLPYIASFHVVTGAALLGCCSLFIMITQSNKLKDFNF
jgi:cytochrome c oxidase assembly protein subunit 15